MKIVLTNKEGEGFEAWRALVNKYEPTSKASVVGKLAEILRTPLDGELLAALTTFERKIVIYEAQSRETISDSLKIGVIAGTGQNSMKEHLFVSATKCDSWTNFVREIESIEHARKTITAPTPMDLDAFQGNCHKCGKHGHTAKECRSSSHGGQRSLSVHNVERNIMDISYHKDSQKGGRKGDRKGNGKGTQKGGKFKGGKGVNNGKGKGRGKKGQRLNEKAEPPEEQWTGGPWEQWPEQSWNAEADTASWRDDDWYRADLNSQTSAAAEEFQHASVGDCDSRIKGFVNLQHVGIWSTKVHFLDVRTALQAETKCVAKERESCAP